MKAQTFKQFIINENSKYLRNGISEFEIDLPYAYVDAYHFPETDTVLKKVSTSDSADQEELNKLGLSSPGEPIESYRINSLKLFYDMDAEFGSTGLEGVYVRMKAVRITGSYSIWNEETQEETDYDFEVEMDEAIAVANVELKYEKSLPQEPTYAEVYFNGGIDPKNIKIIITIGE